MAVVEEAEVEAVEAAMADPIIGTTGLVGLLRSVPPSWADIPDLPVLCVPWVIAPHGVINSSLVAIRAQPLQSTQKARGRRRMAYVHRMVLIFGRS